LARATGTSSTFDVHVHTRDGNILEFSNLPREEIPAVQGYAAALRERASRGSDSTEEGSQEGGGESEAEDSDDVAEDEDFDPEASSDEESGERRARKRRRRGDEVGGEGSLGEEGEEEEDNAEDSSDEDSDEDSDDSGSVELVSEDDFSTGQLKSMMEKESGCPSSSSFQKDLPIDLTREIHLTQTDTWQHTYTIIYACMYE
jgi:hypothetical protein